MKFPLIIMILYFFFLSCTRDPVCDVFVDMREPIEDCYAVTKCRNGAVDQDTLRVCLEKNKKK